MSISMNLQEPDPPHAERARILVAALAALGAAAFAALFAPVESREVAPVLGILWLLDLLVGSLLLLLWAAWSRLEPRRRRVATRWEARLARCRLRHYQRRGTIDQQEAHRLEAWIARRERAADRGSGTTQGKQLE
jgi:hypothetical protein